MSSGELRVDEGTVFLVDDSDAVNEGGPAPSSGEGEGVGVAHLAEEEEVPQASGQSRESSGRRSIVKRTREEENSSQSSASTCPICFERWTSAGEHQISSLACGHVFGKRCVLEWLKRGKRNCPTCKRPARVSHIRPLFLGSGSEKLDIAAHDDAEVQRLEATLAEEQQSRLQAEQRVQVVLSHVGDYAARIMSLTSEGRTFSAARAFQKDRMFLNSVSAKVERSRVVDLHPSGFALVTQACTRGGFSVSKACLLNPSVHMERFNGADAHHAGMIRHLSSAPCHSAHSRSVLTASQDGTAKLIDAHNLKVTATLELVTAAYSCCWSGTHENTVFCGCDRGQFFAYDIRRLDTHLAYYSDELLRGPVHSLVYSNHLNRVVAATHNGCVKAPPPSDSSAGADVVFAPFNSFCHSLCQLEDDGKHLLFSFRGADAHHLLWWNCAPFTSEPTFVVRGHAAKDMLSITSGVAVDDGAVITAGDEATSGVAAWVVVADNLHAPVGRQKFIHVTSPSHPSYILSTATAEVNSDVLVAATSASMLTICRL